MQIVDIGEVQPVGYHMVVLIEVYFLVMDWEKTVECSRICI